MCGIAGFCDYEYDLMEQGLDVQTIARNMGSSIKHRGPDDDGVFLSNHAIFSHVRLAVIDPEFGRQPMTRILEGAKYTIVYNGELYNAPELRQELESLGVHFETNCDTEVLLQCYMHFGENCAQKLNGIYAFAISDEAKQQCFLCRDRFGVKPLFYTQKDHTFIFSSEIKALFQFPGVSPVLNRQSLCEIFGLGPARTAGVGVFKDIYELRPGHCAILNKSGLHTSAYYKLKSYEHTQTYEETVAHVRELLEDIIKRQMMSDVPLCTFLSGGLDSSVVTALVSQNCKKIGKELSTYSFDFTGNDIYFKPTAYQPNADRPFAEEISKYLQTNHHFLECGNEVLADYLHNAVLAKDLPGMADVDASLVYFCSLVRKNHVVALCGECADEIFGGYPWFHKKEAFDGHCFPWSPDLSIREKFLKPELAEYLDIGSYVNQRYEESIAQTPRLEGESAQEARRREISFLNINWFMATLLDRKDRTSMANGLEVRVPYADHRLAEYVFNAPWSYKCHNGVVKSLLRDAAKGWLPEDVLTRRKSPYPKTHNPVYEEIMKKRLSAIMEDKEQPLHELVRESSVNALLASHSDYGKPWFGQLMAGPQMMAYLLQINDWINTYHIRLEL